jgi:hypothetical protein
MGVTFFANRKEGRLQSIKLSTKLPNVALVYADHVWVPATL